MASQEIHATAAEEEEEEIMPIDTVSAATDQIALPTFTTTKANIINLEKEKCEQYNNSTLYNFKNPSKIFHGQMFTIRSNWFIQTPPIMRHSKYSSQFNKNESHCVIKCSVLGTALNYIIVRCREKLPPPINTYRVFDYGEEINFIKFGDYFHVFDASGNDHTKIYDWTKQFEVRFLIQIFGVFAYEFGGQKRLKLMIKIQQMKINKMVEEQSEKTSIMDTCLIQN